MVSIISSFAGLSILSPEIPSKIFRKYAFARAGLSLLPTLFTASEKAEAKASIVLLLASIL